MVDREEIMAAKVKVIILRAAGTNCDEETGFAFKYFGADVDFVHINALFAKKACLSDYHIVAIPGGFSYGDDIAAGRILANELRIRLGEDIRKFIDDGKLIIGICNGFQILTKAGILPGHRNGETYLQEATLMMNDSGKFEDRWIYLSVDDKSVWTRGLGGKIYLPVAHAEGKFVPRDPETLNRMQAGRQVVFRYAGRNGGAVEYPGNPNGSVANIAGISDPTGRILGLMPHPERHFFFTQHPFWTRLKKESELGDGAKIFENGVNHVKRELLR
jgi:phosphoribosylformylglycinamidine synthase